MPSDLIPGREARSLPPPPPPAGKVADAVHMTEQIEEQFGLSPNALDPKAMLGLTLASFLLVTVVLIVRMTIGVCNSAAKKRRHKPLWVRLCELFFGNCDTYSGLPTDQAAAAADEGGPTLKSMKRDIVQRTQGRGSRLQQVTVDAEEEDAPPITIMLHPSTGVRSVGRLHYLLTYSYCLLAYLLTYLLTHLLTCVLTY